MKSRIGTASLQKSQLPLKEEVVSPLLWNISINCSLVRLDFLGFKTIGYAADIAIELSNIHLNLITL